MATTVNITERVTSYESACKELGIKTDSFEGLSVDVIAYIKLSTIAKALNEGWIPKFTAAEYRYYPWFYSYTKEEIARMNKKEKEDRQLLLFGGPATSGATAGVGFAFSLAAFTSSNSHFGARLAVKNRDLARYFGRQFIDIWVDVIFIPEDENEEEG